MRVVVVGQGYVGLPLAIRAAEVGHEVIGYDVDSRRIKTLAAGESFVEDVSSERIRAALDNGSYRPSESARDCGGFDIAVVTVPTPLHEGTPDLRYIKESAITLARYLRPGATVVLESTTYPGTTQELFAPILEDGSGLTAGTDFHLGYSPERIDPGNAVWGFKETPKVVAGVNEASLKAVQDFYAQLVDTTVPVSSPKEAELAKLLENTFRHVNIALVNEIAMFAHHLDIDVWQAIDAASTKPFGFMKFTPGPGVGGHCLPIDPSYLSWRVQRELGQSFRFVELANDINNHMPEYVARRISDLFNEQTPFRERLAHPAARPGVQEEHQRRPRVARPAHLPASARHGGPGQGGGPARGRESAGGQPAGAGRTDPGGADGRRRGGPAHRPRQLRLRTHHRTRPLRPRLPPTAVAGPTIEVL